MTILFEELLLEEKTAAIDLLLPLLLLLLLLLRPLLLLLLLLLNRSLELLFISESLATILVLWVFKFVVERFKCKLFTL